LLAQYLTNRLWEFHQIYNFGEVRHKDKLIVSEVKRSQVKVTARLHMVIWAFWEAFPHFPRMHGHILIKLLAVTHYRGVNVTLMTFWRSRVERSRSPITFCHRHTDGWFAVEDHSVLPSGSLPKDWFSVFW